MITYLIGMIVTFILSYLNNRWEYSIKLMNGPMPLSIALAASVFSWLGLVILMAIFIYSWLVDTENNKDNPLVKWFENAKD